MPTHKYFLYPYLERPNYGIVSDGSCKTNNTDCQYQLMDLSNKKMLFTSQYFPNGTSNIAEYLGLVHAIAMRNKYNSIDLPIFCDNMTVLFWVRKRRFGSKIVLTDIQDQVLINTIDRAKEFIRSADLRNIYKWETKLWGENPADFGRK